MSKKLNFEYVKKYFEDHGCQLLEDKYFNNRMLMRYTCCCGNESKIKWTHFKNGVRCKRCSNSVRNLEEIKQFFEKQGCELLSDEYKNRLSILRFRCFCGEIATTKWMIFQKTKKCAKCGISNRKGEKHYHWNPDREFVNLLKKVKVKYYSAIHLTLMNIGKEKKKNTRSKDLLGYTANELYVHLTNHPNWDTIDKNDRWVIDHIFPIKAFIEHGIFDIKLINALDNLQPMMLSDNARKNSKYLENEFLIWLRSKIDGYIV